LPHFRVDDAFHSHPKAVQAGDEALGLWVRAGSYCMAYLTDGWVPLWWIRQQKRGKVLANRLEKCGLWSPVSRENEPGYQFHEFTGPGRQDSAETIKADREKARQRQEAWRLSRRDSRVTNTVTNGVTNGGSNAESPGIPNPTQPNPTQLVVTLGGELTQVGPHCPRHPNGTSDPCGACADARRAHQAAEADELAARRKQAQATRKAIEDCPHCDEHGMRELNDDTLVRCDHVEAIHA